MRAHATQITVSAPFYALSDGVRRTASGTESYTLLSGSRVPGDHETDLFARLDSLLS
jgi:N-acetyl-1-D-myo-inositol-2-amino-2-deoxy-alpha-D-glucopyranoside deacetylase